MKYRDALDVCLERIRDGEDVDSAVTAFPEHATRLRGEVAAAAEIQNVRRGLPEPSVAVMTRALGALDQELLAARRQQIEAATVEPRKGSFWTPVLYRAAALALLAIAIGAFAGGQLDSLFSGAGKAEAVVLEGVVIERSEASLLVQTEAGTQRIGLAEGAVVADASGDGMPLSEIGAGNMVIVTAMKRPHGLLSASLVRLQAAPTVETWCEAQVERCRLLEQSLDNAPKPCEAGDGCAGGAHIDGVRIRVAAALRIEGLKARCRQGEDDACLQLLELCRELGQPCPAIERQLLRPEQVLPVAPEIKEDIGELVRGCQMGVASACARLRLLCDQGVVICQAPLERPTPTNTPQRTAPILIVPPRPVAPNIVPFRPPLVSTPAPIGPRQVAPTPVTQPRQPTTR